MEWGSQAKMGTKKTLLEFWNATGGHVIVHNYSPLVENWFSAFVVCFFKRHMKPNSLKVASIFMLSKAPQCKSRMQEHYIKFGLWPNARTKHFISIMPLRLAPWVLPCTFTSWIKLVSFTTSVKCFLFLLSRRPRHCSSACRTNLTSSIHQPIQCSKCARWQKERASTGPVLPESVSKVLVHGCCCTWVDGYPLWVQFEPVIFYEVSVCKLLLLLLFLDEWKMDDLGIRLAKIFSVGWCLTSERSWIGIYI